MIKTIKIPSKPVILGILGVGLLIVLPSKSINQITNFILDSAARSGLTLIFDGTPLTDPGIWIRLGILFAISLVVYLVGIFVYEKNKNK